MKVELSKTYKTVGGYKVRLIERIKSIDYQFLGVIIKEYDMEDPYVWTEEGVAASGRVDNLVEVSKYDGFKVDDKVIVWNDVLCKHKGYFAGIHSNGKPMTFSSGATSFSRESETLWDNCVLYDEFYRGKSNE